MSRRLLICYDCAGWAYHKRALALAKYAPSGWTVEISSWAGMPWDDLDAFDLVFSLEYAAATATRRHLKKYRKPPPLVISYNVDQSRNTERWPAVYSAADFVICNSKKMFDWVSRPNKICAISNGIDLEIYRPIVPWKERERKAVWCGSSTSRKGKNYQEVLVPATPILTDELNISCHFRAINEITKDEDIVYPSEKQVEWYNTAKFIAWPSRADGSPNTLIEAVACGCIPVTTECGCVNEFATPENSFIVPMNSVEGFVDGFRAALAKSDDELAAMSENCIATMRERWGYDTRGAYFFNLFDAILSRGAEAVRPFAWDEIEADAI